MISTATKKRIARAIAVEMNERGLSARKLAPVIGVGHATISRLERGNCLPTMLTIARILNWMGKPAWDELLTPEQHLWLVNLTSNKLSYWRNMTLEISKYAEKEK